MSFFPLSGVIATLGATAFAALLAPVPDLSALALVLGGGLMVMALIQPRGLFLGQFRAMAQVCTTRVPTPADTRRTLDTIAEVMTEAGHDAALTHAQTDATIGTALALLPRVQDDRALTKALARDAAAMARRHHQYQVVIAEWLWLFPALGLIATMIRLGLTLVQPAANALVWQDMADIALPFIIGIALSQAVIAPMLAHMKRRTAAEIARHGQIATALCAIKRGAPLHQTAAAPAADSLQGQGAPRFSTAQAA